MVKALSLGLLVATMCCIARCVCAPAAPSAPSPAAARRHQQQLEDGGGNSTLRAERSAVAGGMARKIQFFIKNFHLQILPNGTVNGTLDDGSVYTILQRTAIGIGKLKIQGVGTCQYLCMDACGFLYGSREFHDECVFNELIQEHHYNTYSSTRYSNEKRTLYLALNRRGVSRRVLLHAGHPLGRLSSYTRVLTRTVPQQKLDDLHPVRHHGHNCPAEAVRPQPAQKGAGPMRPPCPKKQRKKRKRKCDANEEGSAEHCGKRQRARQPGSASGHNNSRHSDASINHNQNHAHRCESDNRDGRDARDGSDECQRAVELSARKPSASAKTKSGERGAGKRKKQHAKGGKKRLKATPSAATTTPLPTLEEATDEGDYLDGTTPLEWDDPTAAPTPDEAQAAPQLPD